MENSERALLDLPGHCNLPIRARKALLRLGITTGADLAKHIPDDLLECYNFGTTTLAKLQAWMIRNGLRFRDDGSPEDRAIAAVVRECGDSLELLYEVERRLLLHMRDVRDRRRMVDVSELCGDA